MGSLEARPEDSGGRWARVAETCDRNPRPGLEAANGRVERHPVHGIGPIFRWLR